MVFILSAFSFSSYGSNQCADNFSGKKNKDVSKQDAQAGETKKQAQREDVKDAAKRMGTAAVVRLDQAILSGANALEKGVTAARSSMGQTAAIKGAKTAGTAAAVRLDRAIASSADAIGRGVTAARSSIAGLKNNLSAKKEPEPEPVVRIGDRIEMLNLDSKVEDALFEADIDTLTKLVSKTRAELLKILGVGSEGKVDYIATLLDDYDLSLREEQTPEDSTAKPGETKKKAQREDVKDGAKRMGTAAAVRLDQAILSGANALEKGVTAARSSMGQTAAIKGAKKAGTAAAVTLDQAIVSGANALERWAKAIGSSITGVTKNDVSEKETALKIVDNPIEILSLDIRTQNALKKAGLDTTTKLAGKTRAELLEISGIGEARADRIEEQLKQYTEK